MLFQILQTDTASVLLEAMGYIRFLEGQVQVHYLSTTLYVFSCVRMQFN